MSPVLGMWFLKLYFGSSLGFLHILGPQDVSYVVQVINSS